MTEEELKCQYCGKPAKMYTSPWGVPATLHLCKFHFWLLPFWPALRLHTIFLILIIIVVITAIVKIFF